MTATTPAPRDVVIVEAVRTAIGRGHRERGQFRDLHPNDLLGIVFTEVLRRAGLPGEMVDAVVAGCVHQLGEQGINIARNAWLQEGLPIETAASTVDLQCGSAQLGVAFGRGLIVAGVHDVVVGGGVEQMSHIGFPEVAKSQEIFGTPYTDRLLDRYDIRGQGLGAEMIADAWGIERDELDALALRSHRLAGDAADQGLFEREIVSVTVDGAEVRADQGIRRDTSLEALSQLEPVFRPDGKITAGNASQISDGAAALLLMSSEKAVELGLRSRARILDEVFVGCDPVKMLEGPIPATERLLARNRKTLRDIDRIEINEAFAPVVAAWSRAHEPDMDTVNTRGGAMALGHPVGSTGARLLTSLVHTLEDDDRELGLVTMCCGGGLGTATLVQRL